MQKLNNYSEDQLPSSSTIGIKCYKNKDFPCECHRDMLNSWKGQTDNDYFPQLKNLWKIRLGSGSVSNDTPGGLPLKYEQPG